MKILLIVPAYNEEASIRETIRGIEAYQKVSDLQVDYLIINDGSTDNTKKVIETHQLNAIHLIKNLGIGGAVQTGYLYALYNDYDIAVQFDGDGQHDINSLDTLVRPIADNEVAFTIGSRFVEDSPSEFKTSTSRRIGIKIISECIKLVTGNRIIDVTSGYRAANRELIEYFAYQYPRKYPEPESTTILLKKGISVKEVGVNMFERAEGKSSITPFKSIRYMIEVCTSIIILIGKVEK